MAKLHIGKIQLNATHVYAGEVYHVVMKKENFDNNVELIAYVMDIGSNEKKFIRVVKTFKEIFFGENANPTFLPDVYDSYVSLRASMNSLNEFYFAVSEGSTPSKVTAELPWIISDVKFTDGFDGSAVCMNIYGASICSRHMQYNGTSADYATSAGRADTASYASTATVADRCISATLEYSIQEGMDLPYEQNPLRKEGLYFVTVHSPVRKTDQLITFQVYVPYNINWSKGDTLCSNVVAVNLGTPGDAWYETDTWYRMFLEFRYGELIQLHYNHEKTDVGATISRADLDVIEISRIPLYCPDNFA